MRHEWHKIKKVKIPIIALLTDFGNQDFFVASMQGVIAGINPNARIIDISHHVPSFDTDTAGFILWAVYKYFPKGTIFTVVVDPGVGTPRRILLAESWGYYFIAPDNGVLSFVLEGIGTEKVREISNKSFFLRDITCTFEGRDKMAPAAAWLSKSFECEKFGPAAVSYIVKEIKKPHKYHNELKGLILYKDKFGNLITNIPEKMLDTFKRTVGASSLSVTAGGVKIKYAESYAAVAKDELLFLPGSLGLLEIAAREGSAAERLGLKPGDVVVIS